MDVDAQFHVLAVDDSHVDRKWIERLLKFSSFEVTTVDSGNKALELLGLLDQTNMEDTNAIDFHDHHHDIHVNLIITDYSMPEITGYDLLRKIKESKYLKDIPVIIMSSENIPERINRCLEEGAKEFILKPVQLSDVADKLKPHLTRREHKECDYYNDASCCSKRKRNDECVSPNKSRININTDHDVLPTFIAL